MVHNQPPYHPDHDLPNTNGVASQSPGLIVQSRSEAEARNDLPRDQAPKFTTPTRVVPHSERYNDNVKPLRRRGLQGRRSFALPPLHAGQQHNRRVIGTVSRRAHPCKMTTNAGSTLTFEFRCPHRRLPVTSGDVAYRAEHCSLITPLFSRSASC